MPVKKVLYGEANVSKTMAAIREWKLLNLTEERENGRFELIKKVCEAADSCEPGSIDGFFTDKCRMYVTKHVHGKISELQKQETTKQEYTEAIKQIIEKATETKEVPRITNRFLVFDEDVYKIPVLMEAVEKEIPAEKILVAYDIECGKQKRGKYPVQLEVKVYSEGEKFIFELWSEKNGSYTNIDYFRKAYVSCLEKMVQLADGSKGEKRFGPFIAKPGENLEELYQKIRWVKSEKKQIRAY